MAKVIEMPRLSDTMKEGTVAKWLKKIGDKVSPGQVLAEIETDKATMEFEVFEDGVLLYIGVEEGKTAPVDSILAIVGKKGENIDALISNSNKTSNTKNVASKEENETINEVKKEVNSKIEAPTNTTNLNVSITSTNNEDKRIKVSPLAKSLAKENGINLNGLQGSGPEGRIVKRDIENAKSKPQVKNVSYGLNYGEEKFVDHDISQMRKTIASRLSQSKFTAPHFYLTVSIDCENLISTRKIINEKLESKISFNDFVVKACSLALIQHPAINSSWLDNKIRTNQHVHIGIAVAVTDGLLVPVIKFANNKSLRQINEEVKNFAILAKEKKLKPEDWQGNTFTISNLGMFGIDEFTAIINTPDSCILAVGGIQSVPVVKNGIVVPGNVMKITLSCDHRVVDGVTGASFLNTVKLFLENPTIMLA